MADVDPLQPHAHDPNPDPPHADAAFDLKLPGQTPLRVTPRDLRTMPRTTVPDCTIVSTGHGTSGPFVFGGVALADFLRHFLGDATWRVAEVRSADGFGTRVGADELAGEAPTRRILLADERDGRPLDRADGLVRLIVPGEVDDALRQVKWIGEIRVRT